MKDTSTSQLPPNCLCSSTVSLPPENACLLTCTSKGTQKGQGDTERARGRGHIKGTQRRQQCAALQVNEPMEEVRPVPAFVPSHPKQREGEAQGQREGPTHCSLLPGPA